MIKNRRVLYQFVRAVSRMAQISREFRQATLDIDAIAIPAQERVHGHSMA